MQAQLWNAVKSPQTCFCPLQTDIWYYHVVALIELQLMIIFNINSSIAPLNVGQKTPRTQRNEMFARHVWRFLWRIIIESLKWFLGSAGCWFSFMCCKEQLSLAPTQRSRLILFCFLIWFWWRWTLLYVTRSELLSQPSLTLSTPFISCFLTSFRIHSEHQTKKWKSINFAII